MVCAEALIYTQGGYCSVYGNCNNYKQFECLQQVIITQCYKKLNFTEFNCVSESLLSYLFLVVYIIYVYCLYVYKVFFAVSIVFRYLLK